jgi:hypothetical protein
MYFVTQNVAQIALVVHTVVMWTNRAHAYVHMDLRANCVRSWHSLNISQVRTTINAFIARLNYYFVVPKCGKQMIHDGGTLASPGYPNPYPPNVFCHTLLEVAHTTRNCCWRFSVSDTRTMATHRVSNRNNGFATRRSIWTVSWHIANMATWHWCCHKIVMKYKH